jgi:hypothetical protein
VYTQYVSCRSKLPVSCHTLCAASCRARSSVPTRACRRVAVQVECASIFYTKISHSGSRVETKPGTFKLWVNRVHSLYSPTDAVPRSLGRHLGLVAPLHEHGLRLGVAVQVKFESKTLKPGFHLSFPSFISCLLASFVISLTHTHILMGSTVETRRFQAMGVNIEFKLVYSPTLDASPPPTRSYRGTPAVSARAVAVQVGVERQRLETGFSLAGPKG